MLAQMVLQDLSHVALTLAMTDQQHHLRLRDGLLDSCEVVVVEGRPLSGDIPVMAMAQPLARGPEPMGVQDGVLDIRAH